MKVMLSLTLLFLSLKSFADCWGGHRIAVSIKDLKTDGFAGSIYETFNQANTDVFVTIGRKGSQHPFPKKEKIVDRFDFRSITMAPIVKLGYGGSFAASDADFLAVPDPEISNPNETEIRYLRVEFFLNGFLAYHEMLDGYIEYNQISDTPKTFDLTLVREKSSNYPNTISAVATVKRVCDQ